MKRCPRCNRTYADDTLAFCLDDGTPLLLQRAQDQTLVLPTPFPPPTLQRQRPLLRYVLVALFCLIVGSVTTILIMRDGSTRTAAPTGNIAPTSTASPLTTPRAADVPAKSLLEQQLLGTWKWSSFSQTFFADGTGQYYDDAKFCYLFRYTVKDGVLTSIADGERHCGPGGGAYRISFVGDTMTMIYVDNGYETSWKRTVAAMP